MQQLPRLTESVSQATSGDVKYRIIVVCVAVLGSLGEKRIKSLILVTSRGAPGSRPVSPPLS